MALAEPSTVATAGVCTSVFLFPGRPSSVCSPEFAEALFLAGAERGPGSGGDGGILTLGGSEGLAAPRS